ncbi:histidine phosphatase family protein, partial [Actinotalea sp. JY-7885]
VPRAELTEIDDLVWVSAPTAADLLTRRADRAPLAGVVDLWERGRLATRALAVARHGQAVKRGRWDGSDASRPLTGDGVAQAEALVPVLAAFGVSEVVTSPWSRCLQTVAPYVEASGAALRQEVVLSQDAYRDDPSGAREVASALVADGAGAVAVCTHRPVLPTVLAALAASGRRWTSGELPAENPWLRPGEAVVAHLDRSARAVAFEIHRPPSGEPDDPLSR